MADTPDLTEIVRNIASGDRNAEEQLIEYVAPRVRAMALARTRDRDLARDLTQEILVGVLIAARKDQIRDQSRVIAFVCGVAKNVINNHARRQRMHPESPLDDELPRLAIEDNQEASDRLRALDGALAQLNETDQQLLRLTLVDGMKPGEIAERLRLTPEVVRTRKSRALKRMLDAMEVPSRNAVPRHL
jgi:RNA polymerase sigma-70 factor, ECF subfamily